MTSIYFFSFKTFSCLSRVKTLELLGVVKLEMAVLVDVVAAAVLGGDVVLAPIVVVAIVVNTTDVTVYVVVGGCCFYC